MHQRARTWAMFILRWTIAIGGIWWVLANMTLRDKVLVLDEKNLPHEAVVIAWEQKETEKSQWFDIIDPQTRQTRRVSRSDLVNRPDVKRVTIRTAEGDRAVQLLGLDLWEDLRRVHRLLINDEKTGSGAWIDPSFAIDYRLRVPHPRVEVGVISMIRSADPWLLWAALLVFPLSYLITAYRWHALLGALGVRISRMRAFVLNMVGAFYNTFMPGSTGGDVLKAYYASKQTTHKHRAVISVVVDRLLGLLTLVILGGAMAGWQYVRTGGGNDPAAIACKRVVIGASIILGCTAAVIFIFAHSGLRKGVGLSYLIERLPMQRHVRHFVEVAKAYGDRPGLMLWAVLITFPVHITTVISAIFAGEAFGLPIPPAYYFVAIPVIVLAGAIPISPQGAGVMEVFAIQMTKQYGTTVGQAFALTMSMRLVQIIWNLVGGLFVLRGGYHAPSEEEQAELDRDEEIEDRSAKTDVASRKAS